MASGARIGWVDLPAAVQHAVEEILGGAVVEAVSQPGGFSPGTADRLRTADGRRAFVKAVSPQQNDRTPTLHRREAMVTAQLPAHAPAPRLLGTYDDGTWVALVLEDVEGRHPHTPWRSEELANVLDALDRLAQTTTPSPVDGLPAAEEALGYDFGGWRRVADDPPADLDPWAARNLDELCALADRGLAAIAGSTLVHADIRADNLLVRPDGTVVVVDWPWACRGAAWVDSVLLLINVRLHGGHDTHALLAQRAARTDADPGDLVAALAGVAGYFIDTARRPAPLGIPTVRGFQRAQGDALLAWLAELH
jgi:aminoglycoside phosphotransferase (APT) family kinase protein